MGSRLFGRAAVAILVTSICVSSGILAGTDLTFSGEYFDRSVSSTEAMSLRLVSGDRVQFRAYLPALRVSSPDSVVMLPYGSMPLDEDQQLRRQLYYDPDSGNDGGSQTGTTTDERVMLAQDLDTVYFDNTVTGLGDLRMGMSARLFGRPAGLYLMDFEVDVKAPTADDAEGLGTGEWDGRLGFSGERRFWTTTAFAGGGWTYIGDPEWIDFRNPVDLYGGVESEPLGPGILIAGWLEGNSEIVPGAGSRAALAFGLRNNRRNSWRLSATVGLTDAAEDFGIRLSFTVGADKPRSKATEVRR